MNDDKNHDRATDLVARMNVASTGGIVCCIVVALSLAAFIILGMLGVEAAPSILYLAGSGVAGLLICWFCYSINNRRFRRIYGSD